MTVQSGRDLPRAAQYDALLERAVRVADALEQGQAQTPLHDHLEALRAEQNRWTLEVVLLALTPEAQAQCLSWWFGLDAPSASRLWQAPVHLRAEATGHTMRLRDGSFRRFESPEALVSAAAASPEGRPVLALPSPVGLAEDVRIRLAGDPKLLASHIDALGRLLAVTQVLVVAGSNGLDCPPELAALLKQLSACATLVWPVRIGGDETPSAAPWMPFLTAEPEAVLMRATAIMDGEQPPPLPPLLAAGGQSKRIPIGWHCFHERVRAAFQALQEEAGGALKQARSVQRTQRTKVEALNAATSDPQKAVAREKAALTAAFQQRLQSVENDLKSGWDRILLPESGTARRWIQEQTAALSVKDLAEEEARREIHRMVAKPTLDRLLADLRDLLRATFDEDTRKLDDAVRQCAARVATAFDATRSAPAPPEWICSASWAEVADFLHLDPKSQDARGQEVLDRAGERRRKELDQANQVLAAAEKNVAALQLRDQEASRLIEDLGREESSKKQALSALRD